MTSINEMVRVNAGMMCPDCKGTKVSSPKLQWSYECDKCGTMWDGHYYGHKRAAEYHRELENLVAVGGAPGAEPLTGKVLEDRFNRSTLK